MINTKTGFVEEKKEKKVIKVLKKKEGEEEKKEEEAKWSKMIYLILQIRFYVF